jgi:hypothetical protein
MTNKVECKTCKTSILEVTAKYNDGMCAPCSSDHSSAEFNKTVQSWLDNPAILPGTNGIPEPSSIALSIRASQIRAQLNPTKEDIMQRECHDAFDKAHDKWMSKGSSSLTNKEKFVLVVETFYGNFTNGGLVQFLGNESGCFANWAEDAFEVIGIPQYSKLMSEVKSLFPMNVIPEDSNLRWDEVEKIDESKLENIDQKLWAHYFKDEKEIRVKLYNYLKK